ncbi:MAG: cytochrome c [Sulfuricurvum sp.]|nr:cytochrome c [Sulfuricurvum sp.]
MIKTIVIAFIAVLPLFSGDISNGEKIYKSTCSFCHSIKMTGGMGRDFNLVSYTRTKEEIVRQVREPDVSAFVLGYRANAMPKFNLSEKEVEDVASFVDALQPIKKKSIKSL